jgi:integrase
MAGPHTTTTLLRKKLTEAGVARLKPPSSGRIQVPDGHLTGLWLRVTDKGVKSWSVLYRANGGPVRRLTLGRWPAVGVGEARDLARAALLTAAKGQDPSLLKREQQEQSADRFEAVAAEFIERRCRLRQLRTTREIEAAIGKYLLPAWSGRRVGTITRHDVLKVVDAIADAGHGRQANKVLGLVKRLFKFARRRGVLTGDNPAAEVEKPAREVSRDRVLDDRELAAVWRAAGEMAWPWSPFVRLLVLTAQRRNEVASMRWADLDLEGGFWRMPRELTKMDRSRELPLSGAAVDLLAALPRVEGSPLVFPANRAGSPRPISGYSKMKRRLDAEALRVLQQEAAELGEDPAKLAPWRLHDLRRSFATTAQRIGVRLEVIEAVLGHISGSRAGIVGVYQRHEFLPEQRVALEKWAGHVARLTGGESAKVVQFGSRG